MQITEEMAVEFWKQASLDALRSILLSPDDTVDGLVEMALDYADEMTGGYVDRFGSAELAGRMRTHLLQLHKQQLEEGMSYARQEAALDITGNAEDRAAHADHVGLFEDAD